MAGSKAIIPLQDYKDICDAIRAKNSSAGDAIKSGDAAKLINAIAAGAGKVGEVSCAVGSVELGEKIVLDTKLKIPVDIDHDISHAIFLLLDSAFVETEIEKEQLIMLMILSDDVQNAITGADNTWSTKNLNIYNNGTVNGTISIMNSDTTHQITISTGSADVIGAVGSTYLWVAW